MGRWARGVDEGSQETACRMGRSRQSRGQTLQTTPSGEDSDFDTGNPETAYRYVVVG